MDKKHIAITVVIAVVVGVAGFFGGSAYGKAHAASNSRPGTGQFARNGANGTRRFGTGNDFVNGTVLSKDNNSLTIQMRAMPGAAGSTAAGSKLVILTDNTQIAKTATGTLNDINVGSDVTAIGTDNSDGSMTAQTVQIRPSGQANAPMIRYQGGQTSPAGQ